MITEVHMPWLPGPLQDSVDLAELLLLITTMVAIATLALRTKDTLSIEYQTTTICLIKNSTTRAQLIAPVNATPTAILV
jgi:hypothetical protein